MPRTPDFRKSNSPAELISSIRRPKLIAETGYYNVGEAWDPEDPTTIDVDFTNGWGNIGIFNDITRAPAGWYLAEDGETRLRGVVDGGDVDTVLFNLPEEVRPEYGDTWACAILGGGTANIRVDVNGDVYLESIT